MIEGYTDFFFSFLVLVIFFNFSQVVHPETTGVKPVSEICKGLRFQYWKLCEELILYGRPEFLSVTIRDLRPLQHVMAAVSFIWSQVMSTYVYNMTRQWDVWRGRSEVNVRTLWTHMVWYDHLDHWASLDLFWGVEKRSFSSFHRWNCSQKSSNVTKPVFPCFAKRKHAKMWYLAGSMHSISQHAVIRRYRME